MYWLGRQSHRKPCSFCSCFHIAVYLYAMVKNSKLMKNFSVEFLDRLQLLYTDGCLPLTGVQPKRLLPMKNLSGPLIPWPLISLLGWMESTLYFCNGGLRTSVHPWYISLELLLPWDIYLVYWDLPGLHSFPNRESLIMLLLKHSDQLASPPSCWRGWRS